MRNGVQLGALLAGTVACTSAWAADTAVNTGVVDFDASLNVSERYSDNIYETEFNRQSSWATYITPEFSVSGDTGKTQYKLLYALTREIYHSAHEADHTDHFLTGDVKFSFDARNSLAVSAGYSKVETLFDKATPDENDKYTIRSVGGVYSYGAERARGGLDLGASHSQRRYNNSGTINSEKEYDSTELKSILYLRASSRTRALLEFRHTDYDYELTTSTLNSVSTAYLVGATWDITGITSGSIKAGYEKKDFDSSARPDRESPMWEVDLVWRPLSYSIVTLNARRAFDEGDDGSRLIQSNSAGLNWRHHWHERLATDLYYTYRKADFRGIDREDDIDTAGLKFTYEARRWLDLGIGYEYNQNDSTMYGESHRRNAYFVEFKIHL